MLKSVFTKKTVVITSVLILILSSTVTILMFTAFNKYATHGSIEIKSDDDVFKYNLPGDGSEQNPFLIEGLKFKSDENFDIKIHNTTYSYIVRNCYFSNKFYCLRLWEQNSGSIIVEDNIFKTDSEKKKYSFGMTAQDSSNITIRRNKFLGYSSTSQIVLNIWNCSETLIQENYFKSIDVNLLYGKNIIFNNNEFEGVEDAYLSLYSMQVVNITISNIVSNKGYFSISLMACRGIKILENTLKTGSINIKNDEVEDYSEHQVENNYIAEREYGYFVNITDQILTKQYSMINLIQSDNITISNQDQHDISTGINLKSCSNCTLVNNSITDSRSDSISVYNSNYTSIINNQVIRSDSESIFISSSPNTKIMSCIIRDTYSDGEYVGYMYLTPKSLRIRDSPNSTIENNQINSKGCSLLIETSPYSNITSNKFTSIEIGKLVNDLEVFYTLNIENNTINEKKLGIFINQSNFNISADYNQLIFINCSDISIESRFFDLFDSSAILFFNSTNINISFCYFSSIGNSYQSALSFNNCNNVKFHYVFIEKCYTGVYCRYSSNFTFSFLTIRNTYSKGIDCINGENFSFEHCGFESCRDAIYLVASQNIHISSILCESSGIDIMNCDNITIQNSEFKDSKGCIGLTRNSRINILNNSFEYEIFAISVHNYDTVTFYLNIINNTLSGGVIGIILDSITSPTLIERNAIFGNIGDEFWGLFGGIYAHHCEYLTIKSNYIGFNSRGVFLESTSYSTITYNIFERNINYAIRISKFSHDNLIYQNNFFENNIDGEFQAYDDGVDNDWNSVGLLGNYWSNCFNQDNCKIDGEGLSYDYQPFAEPVDIPYNATYFNITTTNNSYTPAIVIMICSFFMIRVLKRRKRLRR